MLPGSPAKNQKPEKQCACSFKIRRKASDRYAETQCRCTGCSCGSIPAWADGAGGGIRGAGRASQGSDDDPGNAHYLVLCACTREGAFWFGCLGRRLGWA